MARTLRLSMIGALLVGLLASPSVSVAVDGDGEVGAGGTSGAGVGPDKGQGLPSTSRSTPGSPALGAQAGDPAHPADKSGDAVTGDTRVPGGAATGDPRPKPSPAR
jgi:hypothetical protein